MYLFWEILTREYDIPTYEFINRLQSSSGTSGTMRLDSGIDVTALKIGLSGTMAGCGRGK
jgi:hypothetical protein